MANNIKRGWKNEMGIEKIIAILDRYEGDTAILLVGPESKKVLWPREYLPRECKEGQVFSISMVADYLATELARREVEELMREIIAENEKGEQK
jgi:hypothetical protein